MELQKPKRKYQKREPKRDKKMQTPKEKKKWTQEQEAIFKTAKKGNSLVIQACAGAGKTSVALEMAHANPEKKYLLLTYNNHLANDVKEKVGDLNNFNVFTFHGFGERYYPCGVFTDSDLEKIIANRLCPKEADEAEGFGEECGGIPDYDVIIIDETQDMKLIFFRFVYKFMMDMVRQRVDSGNLKPSQIVVMGDVRQCIYEYNGADPRFLTFADQIWAQHPILHLGHEVYSDAHPADHSDTHLGDKTETNMGAKKKFKKIKIEKMTMSYTNRCSPQICKYVNQAMYGHEVIHPNMENTSVAESKYPVTHHCKYNNSRICNIIDDVYRLILECIATGYRPGQIAILAYRVKSNYLMNDIANRLLIHNRNQTGNGIVCPYYFPNKEKQESMDRKVIHNKICFSSIHSSKGLEFDVVFLLDFDASYYYNEFRNVENITDVCPNLLYVGATRALKRLYLFENLRNQNYFSYRVPFLKMSRKEMLDNQEFIRYQDDSDAMRFKVSQSVERDIVDWRENITRNMKIDKEWENKRNERLLAEKMARKLELYESIAKSHAKEPSVVPSASLSSCDSSEMLVLDDLEPVPLPNLLVPDSDNDSEQDERKTIAINPSELIRKFDRVPKDQTLLEDWVEKMFEEVEEEELQAIPEFPDNITIFYRGMEITEDVSDLNGAALTLLLEEKLSKAQFRKRRRMMMNELKTKIEEYKEIKIWNEKAKETAKSIHAMIDENYEILKTEKNSAAFCLRALNLKNAISYNRFQRLEQISEYDWLTDDLVEACMDRFQGVVPGLSSKTVFERGLMDRKNEQGEWILVSMLAEKLQKRFDGCDVPGKVEWWKEKALKICGFMDIQQKRTIWEIKCCENNTSEHKLQLLFYKCMLESLRQYLREHPMDYGWDSDCEEEEDGFLSEFSDEESESDCEDDSDSGDGDGSEDGEWVEKKCASLTYDYHLFNVKKNVHAKIREEVDLSEVQDLIAMWIDNKFQDSELEVLTDEQFLETCRTMVDGL